MNRSTLVARDLEIRVPHVRVDEPLLSATTLVRSLELAGNIMGGGWGVTGLSEVFL